MFDGYLGHCPRLTRLLRHARSAMYRLALSRGHTDDDIEQEALLSLSLAARRYDPAKGTFRGFAWWYMLHGLFDLIKKAENPKRNPGPGRRIERLASNWDGPSPESEDANDPPEWLKLPSARLRTILCLHYGLGGRTHTLKEIAGRIGLHPNRVVQLHAEALRYLRVTQEHHQPRRRHVGTNAGHETPGRLQ